MLITEIIDKKRHCKVLSKEEIEFAIDSYMKNSVSDEQMASLLMAIVINGMTDKETFYLTKSMQNSGKTFSYDFDVVDKHSTGGVSDSTTLILTPILANLGIKVAKMSGGSLGFTGGTKDKLSIFKGYNYVENYKQINLSLEKCNATIIAQSEEVAKADKRIYALRDRTATVESIPLIASSIMSKKLACGPNFILLDVKFGQGAFMKTKKDAIKLAKLMVKIGQNDNKKVWAVISNMNYPLAKGIGSAMEVYSVINALNGEKSDLLSLSVDLTSILYSMVKNISINTAKSIVNKSLCGDDVKNKLKQIILAHNGDISCIDNPKKLFTTKNTYKIKCSTDGYISNIDAKKIGLLCYKLKQNVNDDVKLYQGVYLNKMVGESVKKGEILGTIYFDEKLSNEFKNDFISAFEFSKRKFKKCKLIYKIIK